MSFIFGGTHIFLLDMHGGVDFLGYVIGICSASADSLKHFSKKVLFT